MADFSGEYMFKFVGGEYQPGVCTLTQNGSAASWTYPGGALTGKINGNVLTIDGFGGGISGTISGPPGSREVMWNNNFQYPI